MIYTPFGYQSLAIEASLKSPLLRQLVVMSTGLGKTPTGQFIAKARGGRMLWLAHTDELIQQPYRTCALVWPEATRGIVKAESNEYMRHAVFASIQSAQQERRIAQLAAQQWSQVVVDEAHHALSDGYRRVLEAVGCFREQGTPLLGLTATPERSDQGALSEVFQGVVFQMGIVAAIEGGYLCPPKVVERPLKVDLDAVSTSRGDYGMKSLDLALMKAGIVGEITAAYEEHCAERKTLIFVVSVEQAEQVAAALRARGHSAASISGETPKEERKALLRRLNTGELRTLVNCMVLTEGFDEKSVDAVMLARPTQSKSLMIQMVGRGLRLFPGKTECVVVDLVGASKRNTLVQAAVLFGVRKDPDELPRPQSIDLDPLLDPEEYWRQRLKSQIQGVKGAPRSKLRWIPAADAQGWLLQAGEYGTVRMLSVADEWSVDVVGVRVEGLPSLQRLSDVPVSLDTAQMLAEDYVRRVNAVTLARKGSRWGEAAASDKQVEILTKMGVQGAAQLSKQTASDLITQHLAKKNGEMATSKQLHALRRNGVAIPPNLTKREASKLFATLKKAQ